MAGLIEKTTFEGSIEQTYQVLANLESYADILSDIVSVEILEKKRSSTVAKFEVKIVKTFYYVLEVSFKKNQSISWKLVDSDIMKSNIGGWELKKIDANTTEATYKVEVEFGIMVPKLIINKVLKGNLPNMFAEFQKAISEA